MRRFFQAPGDRVRRAVWLGVALAAGFEVVAISCWAEDVAAPYPAPQGTKGVVLILTPAAVPRGSVPYGMVPPQMPPRASFDLLPNWDFSSNPAMLLPNYEPGSAKVVLPDPRNERAVAANPTPSADRATAASSARYATPAKTPATR